MTKKDYVIRSFSVKKEENIIINQKVAWLKRHGKLKTYHKSKANFSRFVMDAIENYLASIEIEQDGDES